MPSALPEVTPSPVQLDVSDVGSYDIFETNVRAAIAELGAHRFDYLINNAGTSLHASFAETTEAQLDEMYAIHFKAPTCSRSACCRS